uniref:Si:ch73-343l4.8 n=1 Tax=Cyprinus carpio TaxID=7962 RepID=A0A8C1T9L6_CYPCA
IKSNKNTVDLKCYLIIFSELLLIDICVFWSCLSGGSRCLVLITVGLGFICVLLLVFIIMLHITITAERDLIKKSKVMSLRDELKKAASKGGWLFMSTELKSWSDSRQYCRDRAADLVIINTEKKQVIGESVWIGLSDREQEGNMKWVDNSTLKQGFWLQGEPNSYGGDEDCIELNPEKHNLNNWNDRSCSNTRKWICEK